MSCQTSPPCSRIRPRLLRGLTPMPNLRSPAVSCSLSAKICGFLKLHLLGDRDRGSNLRKLGGGENFEFPGPMKFTSFYRDSIENRQFGGSNVQVFEGQLSGRVPPPSVRYILISPIPVSDLQKVQVGADFREGDKDSNFSVFRVRQFTEWPGPLH